MPTVFVACLFAVTMLLVIVAVALRLLPQLAVAFSALLRGFLVLSIRFYYLMLVRLAPFVERRTSINILDGVWRLIATILLSLLLGSVFLLLAEWTISGLILVIFVLHGLLVGLVWDEVVEADFMQLGLGR